MGRIPEYVTAPPIECQTAHGRKTTARPLVRIGIKQLLNPLNSNVTKTCALTAYALYLGQ